MERRIILKTDETCFTIVLIFAVTIVHFAQCASFSNDLEAVSAESEDGGYEDDGYNGIDTIDNISAKNCAHYYPYTYSKCLRLCDVNLEATCIDDQLCLCDSERVQNMAKLNISKEFSNTVFSSGTSKHASCFTSDFCEDLCQNDEKLKHFRKKYSFYNGNHVLYILGALCKSVEDEMQSCVCNLSSRENYSMFGKMNRWP